MRLLCHPRQLQVFCATALTPGSYGITISSKGNSTTYWDVLQVVDIPLINGVYTAVNNGFSPPVTGGNQAYVYANVEGGKIDDYTISIIDSNSNEVGRSISGKYLYKSTLMYKVTLNEGKTFQADETYSIKLMDKTQELCYALVPLKVYGQFKLCDYSFSSGRTTAAFNLKAVNVGISTPDASQTTDDIKPVVNADNSGKAQLTDKQLEKAESLTSAVKAVQMAGIINGNTKAGENASYFAPQDNATRAEAAQMLATLIKGMLK